MKRVIRSEFTISYLLAFIPRLVLILLFAYPMTVTGDELYLLSLPAKLAGYDWSAAMGNYRYYGFGFSIILTPLFIWIEDTVVLYQVILIIIAILQSGIALIACYIMKRFLGITNRFILCTFSLVSVYCTCMIPTYVYNENLYIISIWLVTLCLFFLFESCGDKRKMLIWSCILGVLCLQAHTVHSRAITLVIGVVVVYIIYMALYRRRILYLSPVLAIYGSGYLLNNKIMERIISYLTTSADATQVVEVDLDTVGNTSVSFSIPFAKLTDSYYIEALEDIIIGQLNTWNFFVGGLAIVSGVLGIYLFVKSFAKKQESIESHDAYMIIWWIFMTCIGVTILGQAFSWGGGYATVIMENDYNNTTVRAVSYLRYLIAYYPPILLMTMVYLVKYREMCKELLKYIIGLTVLSCVAWLKLVVPFIQNSYRGIGEVSGAFGWIVFADIEITYMDYVPSVVVTLLVIAVLVLLILRNQAKYVGVLLLIVLLYQYGFTTFIGYGLRGESNYEYVAETINVLDELGESFEDVPVYAYSISNPDTFQGGLYLAQYLRPEMYFVYGSPSESEEEAIYWTNKEGNGDYLIERGYECYEIEEGMYFYVMGDELQSFFGDKY